MASAGKILLTASSSIRAGSRRERSAARSMRARTAASLSARPSMAVFKLQYPTGRMTPGLGYLPGTRQGPLNTHRSLVVVPGMLYRFVFNTLENSCVLCFGAKLTSFHLTSHITETVILVFLRSRVLGSDRKSTRLNSSHLGIS